MSKKHAGIEMALRSVTATFGEARFMGLKPRQVLYPDLLLSQCQHCKTEAGPLFLTRLGVPMRNGLLAHTSFRLCGPCHADPAVHGEMVTVFRLYLATFQAEVQ